MINIPKKTKFKKQFKGTLKGTTFRGNKIIFGDFGVKTLEEIRITSKQIESIRKNIIKKMKRLGFLWIRVFTDTPITKKPTEIRMGKGKGSVNSWCYKAKKGQILFEISGVSELEAKNIFKSSLKKLSVPTKFVKK